MSAAGADKIRLLGIYRDADGAARAIERLEVIGLSEHVIFSPIPIDAPLPSGAPSRVRVYALAGGIIGCISGFALTIYTSLDWPLITGGKPIVSLPPFVVIAFELTILLAALGAFAGLLLSARLPRLEAGPYDPRFSEDRFGVLAVCRREEVDAVRSALEAAGCEEVRIERKDYTGT